MDFTKEAYDHPSFEQPLWVQRMMRIRASPVCNHHTAMNEVGCYDYGYDYGYLWYRAEWGPDWYNHEKDPDWDRPDFHEDGMLDIAFDPDPEMRKEEDYFQTITTGSENNEFPDHSRRCTVLDNMADQVGRLFASLYHWSGNKKDFDNYKILGYDFATMDRSVHRWMWENAGAVSFKLRAPSEPDPNDSYRENEGEVKEVVEEEQEEVHLDHGAEAGEVRGDKDEPRKSGSVVAMEVD